MFYFLTLFYWKYFDACFSKCYRIYLCKLREKENLTDVFPFPSEPMSIRRYEIDLIWFPNVILSVINIKISNELCPKCTDDTEEILLWYGVVLVRLCEVTGIYFVLYMCIHYLPVQSIKRYIHTYEIHVYIYPNVSPFSSFCAWNRFWIRVSYYCCDYYNVYHWLNTEKWWETVSLCACMRLWNAYT